MNVIRTLGAVALGIVLLFFARIPCIAAGEFQADYDVQYALSPSGKTIVTQHVTLTNKLPNFYPKQYSLLLDSDKIKSVIAYDDGGVITPTISVKDGKTDIGLSFNVKTIGLGKSFSFSLRYEHNGVAVKNGSIWEIYIPGIANDPDIGTYTVTLAVPPNFGQAAYISPLPVGQMTWNKAQMIAGGVSAAYGSRQYFDVKLTYTLVSQAMGGRQSIALPPDTAFQKVTLLSLSPKPETVEKDRDGNWLATYDVLPSQTKTVTAHLSIATSLSPRPEFHTSTVDTDALTKPLQYWESTNPSIVELSKKYRTPEEIYTYVSHALTYDYSKVSVVSKRLGAVLSLSKPKEAVCVEFTDLFIAIARAAGIPARRVVGYAYTANPKLRPTSIDTDVLHAWPEYYDSEKKLWIPVDPTWAHTTGGADYFTKLDFNHIAFAINGLDSVEPYPAGFYHSTNAPGSDISVSFSDGKDANSPANITSVVVFPEQVGAGTNPTGEVRVTNKGGESAYVISVSATSDIGNVHRLDTIEELLPYATVRLPFSATFPQSLTTKTGTITVKVNDALIKKSFTVKPIIWLLTLIVLCVILGIVVGIKLFQLVVWKRFRKP